MAEKLTPQQEQAVTNRGGKLLVSAAAGSGKTKVLVDRLMSYLTDPDAPANLDEFLIITYTKAAAAELRGKIAAKLSEHIAADPSNMHLPQYKNHIDDSLRTSVGVGIYWNTPMGPMNFSWGWPLKMTDYDREQRFLLSFETQF